MMYRTIDREGESRLEEKKSIFIGHIVPVTSEEEVAAHLEREWAQHREARHIAYAYVLGADRLLQRYDDDKEPQRTAGLPILDVLHGGELTNVLCMVTRYFGGTLLGTGGLVRNYGGAAREALKKARVVTMRPYRALRFQVDYGLYGSLEYQFAERGLPLEEVAYSEEVTITTLVREEHEGDLRSLLQEMSSGTVKILQSEELTLAEEGEKLLRDHGVFDQSRAWK
ncbi:MAG: YigZ family protein [Tissierellia bacterium]|nr:YigZ family protein [Tissierellia bacterium]